MTVVLISKRTTGAFYEGEEIVNAIRLSRDHKAVHRVVPIYSGSVSSDGVPYGLSQFQSITWSKGGLSLVVDELQRLISDIREVPDFVARTKSVDVTPASESELQELRNTIFELPESERSRLAEARRATFFRLLREALHGRIRRLSLAIIDVDGQTRINEKFGDEAGAMVLAGVQEMLTAKANGKRCGRLGGDSYFLLIEDADCDRTIEDLGTFCEAVKHRDWSSVAHGMYVTCTVGIAEWRKGEDGASLVKRAIGGVRVGKIAGGNRVKQGPFFAEPDPELPWEFS
jgi:diguanylate cyclase (GGDEF)-like protein